MRILPTGGSLFKKRSRKVRRQELIGAGPAPDDVETNEVALPPATQTSRETITVINGHTVVAPIQSGPSPVSPTSTIAPVEPTSPSVTESSDTTTRRRRPSLELTVDDEDGETSDSSSSTASTLDSPPTGVILSASSPSLDESEVSHTSSRTKNRPEKTSSATKTKSASPSDESEQETSPHGKETKSATKWVAIVAGVVGGLLLLMAVSAYYRRWRRKRKEQITAAADDESFVTTKQADPAELPSNSPIWNNALMQQPRQVPFHNLSDRGSPLPEPGSEPRPEDAAPWRRDSYAADPVPLMAPIAVPRHGVRNEPTVIETSGDSRLFSRPVSEVVLNGQSDQVADQYYDYGPRYAQPNVRHNSYTSTGYEAIDDPHRTTLDYHYFMKNT